MMTDKPSLQKLEKFFRDNPRCTFGLFLQTMGRVITESRFNTLRKRWQENGTLKNPNKKREVSMSAPVRDKILDLMKGSPEGIDAKTISEKTGINIENVWRSVYNIRRSGYRVRTENDKYFYEGEGEPKGDRSVLDPSIAKLLDKLIEVQDSGMSVEEMASFCGTKINTVGTYIHEIRGANFRVDLLNGRYFYRGEGPVSKTTDSRGNVKEITVNRKEYPRTRKDPAKTVRAAQSTRPAPQPKPVVSSNGHAAFTINQEIIDKASKMLAKPVRQQLQDVVKRARELNEVLKVLSETQALILE